MVVSLEMACAFVAILSAQQTIYKGNKMTKPHLGNGAPMGAPKDSSKENIATKRKHDEFLEDDNSKVLVIPDLFKKLMSRAYSLNPHYESVRNKSLD